MRRARTIIRYGDCIRNVGCNRWLSRMSEGLMSGSIRATFTRKCRRSLPPIAR